MAYGDAQKLRWVFPGPLRDARLPLQRSQLDLVPKYFVFLATRPSG